MRYKICLHTTHQISQNYIGGTERFLIKMAKELQLLGWTPFIVCSSTTEKTYVEGIEVIGRLPKQFRSNALNYKQLNYNFLRNEVLSSEDTPYEISKKLSFYVMMQLEGIQAEIFHLNSFLSVFSLDDAITNVIVTNHENNLEMDATLGQGFFENYSQLIRERKLLFKNIKGLYTPSKFYADYFSKKLGMRVDPIKLGVHISDFHPIPNKQKPIDEQLVDIENHFIILLPARLNTIQKGHDIALKSCKKLKETGIKFKLVITGLGKSSENDIANFRKEIRNYEVEDTVILSSYSDIMNAFRSCDVVISPERYCSYGLAISESLSLGINTVLSDIPTYREIASGYQHAYFFENENHDDLTDRLLMLYQKRNTTNQLDTIRFRIENDIRDCAKSYSRVYARLLSK
ncbi:MAG: glycosyltransferase [Bacteroidota bacterium]